MRHVITTVELFERCLEDEGLNDVGLMDMAKEMNQSRRPDQKTCMAWRCELEAAVQAYGVRSEFMTKYRTTLAPALYIALVMMEARGW